MSSIIPIAYYTGVTIPAGTSLQGNLIIGDTAQDYGAFPNGYRFWATTDLDGGWCIANQVPAGNQPNPLNIPCFVGFFSGATDDEESFLNVSNYLTGQNFVDGPTAANYLNANGFWTNYNPTKYKILSWDIQNNASYNGSGSVITDLLGRVNGSISGSTTYTAGSPKYLSVVGSTSQYIVTSSSLTPYQPISEFSTLLWVYPTANGVILDELGQTQAEAGWHDSQIQLVGGTLRFDVWDYLTPSFNGIVSSVATPLNNWYQISMTYDGTTLRAYVNGQLAGSKSKVRQAPSQNGFQQYYALGPSDTTNLSGSGAGGVGGQFRFGSFEVYNYGITGAQVIGKFNATKGQYGY